MILTDACQPITNQSPVPGMLMVIKVVSVRVDVILYRTCDHLKLRLQVRAGSVSDWELSDYTKLWLCEDNHSSGISWTVSVCRDSTCIIITMLCLLVIVSHQVFSSYHDGTKIHNNSRKPLKDHFKLELCSFHRVHRRVHHQVLCVSLSDLWLLCTGFRYWRCSLRDRATALHHWSSKTLQLVQCFHQ